MVHTVIVLVHTEPSIVCVGIVTDICYPFIQYKYEHSTESYIFAKQMGSSKRWPVMVVLGAAFSLLIPAIIFHDISSSRGMFLQSVSVRNKTMSSLPVPPSKDTLFYYHDPGTFLRKFSECFFEGDYCHVLYWHVQKTGGSYLASRLYPVYNRGEWYDSRSWCCNDKFMKNEFWPNVTTYCSKKLGVYEVRPKEYVEVVRACQDFREKRFNASETTKRHRYIGLVSVREPIERTLSAIHQQCNVHSGQLHQDTHDICERCSYEEDADKPFYEKFVNKTNDAYIGLKETIILSDPKIDIPLYIIDNEQIDVFFEKLEDLISLRSMHYFNRTFHFPQGKSNSEKSDKLCDFGMPSALMRQHRSSLQAYHWLWYGDYLGQ